MSCKCFLPVAACDFPGVYITPRASEPAPVILQDRTWSLRCHRPTLPVIKPASLSVALFGSVTCLCHMSPQRWRVVAASVWAAVQKAHAFLYEESLWSLQKWDPLLVPKSFLQQSHNVKPNFKEEAEMASDGPEDMKLFRTLTGGLLTLSPSFSFFSILLPASLIMPLLSSSQQNSQGLRRSSAAAAGSRPHPQV